MRYLKKTRDIGSIYTYGQNEIEGYSDADFAADNKDEFRHSTSGVLINYGGGPVVFISRKQSAIALSSTESEYIAAFEAAKELMWLTNIFKELDIKLETIFKYR